MGSRCLAEQPEKNAFPGGAMEKTEGGAGLGGMLRS